MKIIAAIFLVHFNGPLTPLLTNDISLNHKNFCYIYMLINSVLIMKTRVWCALQVCGRDWIGCHAGCQEVSKCCTISESSEHVTCMPPSRANKAETLRRLHQKSKTGVSVASQKRTYVLQIMFLKIQNN